MLALYRLGAYIPAPGVDVDSVEQLEDNFAGSNILGFLNLFSGGSLSRLSLFALGIMPYITASIILQLLTVVVPSLERLQKEGEVGQQKITQYTRYLTVGLAFAQSVGYVFLFQSSSVQRRRQRRSARPDLRQGDADRDLAHRGLHAADVAGRADHPARDRQRDLADDLRLDRRRDPRRDQRVVDQPRPGLRRDDALRRARRDRRHRLRPGGPAADPGPVRQARRRPPDDDRRLHLPAAAREHGGRDPGHLRRLDHGLPADDRPAAQHPGRARLRRLLQPERLGLRGRRGLLHHHLHLLLHGGHLQPGRPGRQPEEVRRASSPA